MQFLLTFCFFVGSDDILNVSLRLSNVRISLNCLNWLHDFSTAHTCLVLFAHSWLELEIYWIVHEKLIFLKIEAESLLDRLQVILLQLYLVLLNLGSLYQSC